MTRRGIAALLDGHPNWGWAADDDGPEGRIRCTGCSAVVGEVTEFEHPEIQTAQADSLQNAHQADMIWTALATSGQVEWGVSWHGTTPYGTEDEARRNLQLAQLDVAAELVRRVVTPWEVVP